jgi:hypothetical protein
MASSHLSLGRGSAGTLVTIHALQSTDGASSPIRPPSLKSRRQHGQGSIGCQPSPLAASQSPHPAHHRPAASMAAHHHSAASKEAHSTSYSRACASAQQLLAASRERRWLIRHLQGLTTSRSAGNRLWRGAGTIRSSRPARCCRPPPASALRPVCPVPDAQHHALRRRRAPAS